MKPSSFGPVNLAERPLPRVPMAVITTRLVYRLDGRWWCKGGSSVGRTDDFGYKAIEDKWEIHDLHATMLHLLGIEHTKSTFRFSGRDMRLTDVHGHIIKQILA